MITQDDYESPFYSNLFNVAAFNVINCILKVNTSVRSESKAAFLKDLEGAAERLTIFPGVDLLEPGSYQECISGCDVVLHTASPFFFVGGSEEALVKPALEGRQPSSLLTALHETNICTYVSLCLSII